MDSAQKPKQNNPFAGYNTVAYVPPRGEGDINVNGNDGTAAGGLSTSVSGNASGGMRADTDNLGTSTNGNASQTRGEALEASLQPQAVSNSSLNQKSLETPKNSLKTQNGEKSGKKSGKKWPIVVAVIVVLAAIGGVAVWFLQRGKTEDLGQEKVGIQEIAIDSDTVQDVYKNFDTVGSPWEDRWSFYVDEGVRNGDVPRELMLILVLDLENSSVKDKSCKGTSYNLEYANGEAMTPDCIRDGERITNRVKKMFGKDLELVQGEVVGSVCGGWHYDQANDEFWRMVGCGGSWPAGITRDLYRAEIDNKGRLYLYERALMQETSGFYHIGNKEEMKGEFVAEWVPEFDFETGDYEEYEKLASESQKKVLQSDGEVYKWTFVKDTNGNYIFEKLEKVEK